MINSKLELSPSTIDVFIGDFESINTPDTDLLKILDTEEKVRFNKFSNEKAKRHYLVARSSLKLVLENYLEKEASQISFFKGAKGKPYLKGNHKIQPFFNLSHSHNRFLISVSDSINGIDIEFLKKKVSINPILNRFFSKTEQISFNEFCGSSNDIATFLRGWTRKEAILKATGEGVAGLSKISVSFSPSDEHAFA